MGLLHLTYASLDQQHKLMDKFGLSAGALLADVAKKLGAKVPADQLLSACLGGSLDAITPHTRAQ
jgi:hypothetical protein